MAITGKNNNNDFAALSAQTSGVKPNEPAFQAQPDVNAQASAAQANFSAGAQLNQTAAATAVKRGIGLLNGIRRTVPYNQTEARVSSFLNAFEKVVKEQIPNLETDRDNWEFRIFDANSNRSPVSAILFIRDEKSHVAVFPWVIQDPNQTLADKVLQIPAMYNAPATTIQIPQLTEELLTSDGELGQAISRYVSSLPKYVNRDVLVVTGRIIPTKLEPSNEAQIRSIIYYGSDALESSLLALNPNREHFNIAMKSPDENLVARMEFNPGLAATSVGLPVRNDLAVRLSVVEKAAKNSLAMNRQLPFSVTRTWGELIYTGGNPQFAQMAQAGMMGYGFNPAMMSNPMFRPAIVISSMDNQFEGGSLETQLLALNSAALLATNNNWWNLFRPNHAITTIGSDPQDIGMITADVAYPGEELGYTNTKAEGFNFAQFMMKYIEQDVLIKLDVDELGDLTYLQQPFLYVSGISGNAQDQVTANTIICQACNHLTDGKFAKYWNGKDPIVVDSDRIEVGYYVNDKGELRPLSEIDYRYIANLIDINVARDYQDSFNSQMYPDDKLRFSKRKAIYDMYFAGSYEITGFARRLTFNSQFIIALSQAMNDANGVIAIEHNYNNNATVERGNRNQIIGIQANQIGQFVYGGFNYGNGQQATTGVWRNYNGYNLGNTYL